jgi:outer membrane biosynthesis protein TonB
LPEFKVLTAAQVMDYYGLSAFNSFEPAFYRNKQKLSDYVAQRVVYPQKAIENNIEGEVEIGFSIERNGTPFNYRLIRGVGYGCEDAVINVVIHAPKWKPAFINGRPIVGQSSVVINFKLIDK